MREGVGAVEGEGQQEELLTANQAASWLGVSERTLKRWERKGLIRRAGGSAEQPGYRRQGLLVAAKRMGFSPGGTGSGLRIRIRRRIRRTMRPPQRPVADEIPAARPTAEDEVSPPGVVSQADHISSVRPPAKRRRRKVRVPAHVKRKKSPPGPKKGGLPDSAWSTSNISDASKRGHRLAGPTMQYGDDT